MTYPGNINTPQMKMAIMVIMLFFAACSAPEDITTPPNFEIAVRHHLDSVENRDLETFSSTLTQSDELYVIFPGGGLLDGTQAVIDFHREWFKDEDWVFRTEIVKTISGSTQSTALVRYDFQDTSDGPVRQAWLVLTFQLENGEWRLIHDQNTRIDG